MWLVPLPVLLQREIYLLLAGVAGSLQMPSTTRLQFFFLEKWLYVAFDRNGAILYIFKTFKQYREHTTTKFVRAASSTPKCYPAQLAKHIRKRIRDNQKWINSNINNFSFALNSHTPTFWRAMTFNIGGNIIYEHVPLQLLTPISFYLSPEKNFLQPNDDCNQKQKLITTHTKHPPATLIWIQRKVIIKCFTMTKDAGPERFILGS